MTARPPDLYKLEGIAKVFPLGTTGATALQGVSVTIGKGETIALQGPSGSGKSTLLNVLGLIEVPSAGTIEFLGTAAANLNAAALTAIRRESIGFIFQNFNLIPILTATENVEYVLFLMKKWSRREVRARALAALDSVGLSAVAEHRPSQLSGGQRQRVAIARALAKEPAVVLADEPTANLDSKSARQILELMVDLNDRNGMTMILATHDDTMAAYMRRRIGLVDGKVVSGAKPEAARQRLEPARGAYP